jgi:hypothetical protein
MRGSWWPVEAFEMSGEVSSYDGLGFCARCGSRVVDATHTDSHIEIRVGSLDDGPFELRPAHEVWVKRRESLDPAGGGRSAARRGFLGTHSIHGAVPW